MCRSASVNKYVSVGSSDSAMAADKDAFPLVQSFQQQPVGGVEMRVTRHSHGGK